VPTISRQKFVSIEDYVDEPDSKLQCVTLERNVWHFGLTPNYFGLDDARQGIVHVIGPEQGFTLPGTTVVCGDSHTSTHGAFGALAFGIGTSEVEHVLATQCLVTRRSKNIKITVDGLPSFGVTSKDIILHVIGKIGTAGGTSAVLEYYGSAISSLSVEARMSICNMSIEAGATAGIIAPDRKAIKYMQGRPMASSHTEWSKAVKSWSGLRSDPGAVYDREIFISAADVAPTVTWGTSPQDVVAVTGKVPDPNGLRGDQSAQKAGMRKALDYIGLLPGTPIQTVQIDKVFIGSCTNSRIEDLRLAAQVVHRQRIAPTIELALVVPGSGQVKLLAEKEGLHTIFTDAGFEWREAGCSLCLGMNPDVLSPGERCASTSNRNF
jgi:3-isopropylmalate dehydratase